MPEQGTGGGKKLVSHFGVSNALGMFVAKSFPRERLLAVKLSPPNNDPRHQSRPHDGAGPRPLPPQARQEAPPRVPVPQGQDPVEAGGLEQFIIATQGPISYANARPVPRHDPFSDARGRDYKPLIPAARSSIVCN